MSSSNYSFLTCIEVSQEAVCSYLFQNFPQFIVIHTVKVFAEYIMWNAGLDESQAGIKISGEISTTTDMQMIPL